MKIGFTGATGCVDFGDYAMLVNNINQIKSRASDTEFCIFSYNGQNTHKALQANGVVGECTIVDDVLACMGEDYGNVPNSALIEESIEQFNTRWKELFDECISGTIHPKLEPLIKELSTCDLLLFNGGGYLNQNWIYRVYAFLIIIVLAERSAVRVVMMPQTYGPFATETEADVSRAFKLVDRFYSRDRIFSKNVLTSLGIEGSKIVYAIDDLFLLSEPLTKSELKVPDDALFIQLHKQMLGQIDGLVSGFSNLITNLVNEERIKNIVFVVFHHDGGNELKIAEDIQSKLSTSIHSEVWGPDWNAGNLIGGFVDAKAVLCSRYHPLVIALRQGTPVVNLLAADNAGAYDYYGAKNRGICEYVGVDDRLFCVKSDHPNVLEVAGEMLRQRMDTPIQLDDSRIDIIERERAAMWDYIVKNV
jgi:polysaccharide pyruvyl transferase WcaK-like protein